MICKKLCDKLSKYDLIVFDMDGTLYFQKSMQLRMGLKLLGHAVFHKGGAKDLKVILNYRKLREKWDSTKEADDDALFEELSKNSGKSSAQIKETIDEWMFKIPLDIVKESRDSRLIETIGKLLEDGKKICVYSDYAAADKCRAVGLAEDIRIYCCGDGNIRTMKPNPAGLNFILSQYPDVDKDKAIMVGDRKDRDGKAAENAGIDSLILKRFKVGRKIYDI